MERLSLDLIATALGKIEESVPPVAIQGWIVEHMQVLAEKTQRLNDHLDAVEGEAEALLLSMHHRLSGDRVVRLGDLIELFEYSVKLEGQYPQVGVRGFGGGLFAKSSLSNQALLPATLERVFATAG